MKKILVTGGAGFIGSQFVYAALEHEAEVLVIDSLTYAGNLENLALAKNNPLFQFVKADICDFEKVSGVISNYKPSWVVNFAAESHVDNSISGPKVFVETNISGTFSLLEASRSHFDTLSTKEQDNFRYLQVSTDEVFGELGETGFFHENSPYKPHSPYSATKAGADHLVRAWNRTYGIPTLITNCTNNYGPRQFPEKLIPFMIQQALSEKELPIYGKGLNVRDWIHVEDHCRGIWLALSEGVPGKTYCFGGNSERTNIQVVESICNTLDRVRPRNKGSFKELISFIKDRPGHDWRYAIDDSVAEKELGYKRKYKNFEDGLMQTVQWYLGNPKWTELILNNPQKSPFL